MRNVPRNIITRVYVAIAIACMLFHGKARNIRYKYECMSIVIATETDFRIDRHCYMAIDA